MLNKRDRQKRYEKVIINGNKTPEGRLKIDEIRSLQDDSGTNKINGYFWLIIAGFEVILRVILLEIWPNAKIDKLITIYRLIPGFLSLAIRCFADKIKVDKEIRQLEDEILDDAIEINNPTLTK